MHCSITCRVSCAYITRPSLKQGYHCILLIAFCMLARTYPACRSQCLWYRATPLFFYSGVQASDSKQDCLHILQGSRSLLAVCEHLLLSSRCVLIRCKGQERCNGQAGAGLGNQCWLWWVTQMLASHPSCKRSPTQMLEWKTGYYPAACLVSVLGWAFKTWCPLLNSLYCFFGACSTWVCVVWQSLSDSSLSGMLASSLEATICKPV